MFGVGELSSATVGASRFYHTQTVGMALITLFIQTHDALSCLLSKHFVTQVSTVIYLSALLCVGESGPAVIHSNCVTLFLLPFISKPF